MKIIKWSIVFLLSALAIWFLLAYYKCKRKGDELGCVFECNPFSSNPEILVPQDPKYKMSEGKCYEITDYGKKMSFRQVGLSQCGESEVRRSNIIEEAIYQETIQ